MLAQELGIDLGSAHTVVVSKNKGIVAKEPSVVAIDQDTKQVIAVGEAAHRMVGRTPDSILPVHPVRSGVISDMNCSTMLLKHMIRTVARSRWLRPHLLLPIQADASDVDKRALAQAASQAGAGVLDLVPETVAAALGADLPVDEPVGSLLMDIGSGTTDVAVISLGGVVLSASTAVAGKAMDDAVARHLKKYHNLLVGQPTAERLKIELGSALPGSEMQFSVTGRLLTTGRPSVVTVTSEDVYEAVKDLLEQIDALVLGVLERTPPELLADISHSGLILTGGGALLHRLSERLARATGLAVTVAEEPIEAVARGAQQLLERRTKVILERVKI